VLALLRLLPVDWDELSSVGQSFGGISALLAAVALAVLARSIALQGAQTELNRMQSAREMQFHLMTRVLDDPTFAEPFLVGESDEQAVKRFRLGVFMTLHFRYLEFAFVTGGMSEAQLRRAVNLELFSRPAFRSRWQEIRPHWSAVRRGREAMFVRIIDEEFYQACREARPVSNPVDQP